MIRIFPVRKDFCDVLRTYPRLLLTLSDLEEEQRAYVLEQVEWNEFLQAALLFAGEEKRKLEKKPLVIEVLGNGMQTIWIEEDLLCMDHLYAPLAEYVRRKYPCWIMFDMERMAMLAF